MATCTRKLGCQVKPKLSVKKENVSDSLLSSMKSLLQSRKELCNISECLKGVKKGHFIEITFLGLSEESGSAQIQDLAVFHADLPELIRSLHLCSLKDNELILLKDGKEDAMTYGQQSCFPGITCVMTSAAPPYFKSDLLFILLSKYATGIRYTVEHHYLNKTSHNEDDDTNQSVSSIEDDFVTAFEHLDEEELATNAKQETGSEIMRNQRDAASQTQPVHCVDISGSKILFSSVRRRSSIKSATLMSFIGLPDLSSSVKNTVTTSVCDSWKQMSFSTQGQDTKILSPPSAESSESECSSPSPIIFLDEEGYQKSMRAKLNLPKIPVVKDGIEDSDSELSEFFDSFDRFDEPEPSLENHHEPIQKSILASPPKKKKCAYGQFTTAAMNPQKFKYDRPTLSANVKKPTPLKPESPYNNMSDVPDSPRPVKTSVEDTGTLFSPIRSSAFSPLGISTPADCFYHLDNHEDFSSIKDRPYSDYANRVCVEVFDSVLNGKPSTNLDVSKRGLEKTTKLKRKSHHKDSERRLKSKQKPKSGIQKFATELVEKSLGSAFKDLQKGVSSCTSALCHLAARLTSYVFQMAFYEIGRRQAFSIKKRAINSLANLMVSEVITSALQELRYIKKQMVTNAITRFASDLAEELVFEGIMEVCQFSHPPTPTAAPRSSFDFDNGVVSSYAKDLSESVIQEAFIELSQVNVTFTTQAAISVSMDNLKYVSSEGMMQSTQTSITFPNLSEQTQTVNMRHDSKKDYTVQHALIFTSGLVSSVPVPVAAKALSQQQVSNEFAGLNESTDISVSDDMCLNILERSNISTKRIDEIPSTKTILPASKNSITNSPQQHPVGVNSFSVNMMGMIVNEAYDVISSSKGTKTVGDYAEMLVNKVVEVPSQRVLMNREQSKHNFADNLAKCILQHSVDETRWMPITLTEQDKSENQEMHKYSSQTVDQQLMVSRQNVTPEFTPKNPCFIVKRSAQEYKGGVGDALSSTKCLGGSDISFDKMSSEAIPLKRNVHNSDAPYSSMFGLQTCLSHINSFSSVMCSCGDDFFIEEKTNRLDSNVITLPGTPPPTPLSSYEISPERSMRKLNKKLKGELSKEFYPATPPPTPHLSAFEHDCTKRDDFMLKVMRSLSEEVETSSSEDYSEELTEDVEVSEETSQYANYLSTNILSIATEMAAYCLDEKSVQGATLKNRSLLSVLSDKWGYPAYMRNISEETLDALFSYASNIAGEVLGDAKRVLGKRQSTQKKKNNCDIECCNFRKHDDCRLKERGCMFKSMNFKETDCTTLSLPQNNGVTGLTSKYPSCESVTEEYADHIIRVLKMEGANNELIIDQYASRLAYRAIKTGLQQASNTIKLKCNQKIIPRRNSEANSTQEILRLLSMTHHQEREKNRRRSIALHSYEEELSVHRKDARRTEFTGLLHFAESLAHTITCDVKRKLKMSAASLPKSLTDSCLYTKSKIDNVSGDLVKTTFSKTLLPFSQKHKLYHSTGSLNEHCLKEGIIQAIEQYACKVVDSTLEFSMETARLQAVEKKKKTDKIPYTGKLMHSYNTACRLCSAKEQQGYPVSSCHFLLGHDVSRKIKQYSRSKHGMCQKSRLFHLNIPKIHIDLDKRAVFAEKMVNTAFEKAERELNNTSLAADSDIGQDGISFAESLTTEIMMSAIKNIGHVVNVSSNEKDGFQSAESVTSQQTSVSVGDDSTGSWSNLSFEDEHQDESSSFLHLSDSNGNSSSWSSLGLEGDMYEENLSFLPSDSDGAEERDVYPKASSEAKSQQCKILLIRNVDFGPSTVQSQLRTALQWIVASESDISELCFPEAAKKELLTLSRRLSEKAWKVGDLLQAVIQYCEAMEKSSHWHQPLFGWLLENF
ncbi:A-kinase anchor protein 11 [Rhinophrynus dorsalis]